MEADHRQIQTAHRREYRYSSITSLGLILSFASADNPNIDNVRRRPKHRPSRGNQMQVLITGGLGFIGSNLIRHFLKKYPNYTVINLDALTYAGHLENLLDEEKNPHYVFVRGSISDAELVNEIMSGAKFGPIDGILNLAAETHVDRSIVDPSVFVTTNVLGTQILLDAALTHGKSDGNRGGKDR